MVKRVCFIFLMLIIIWCPIGQTYGSIAQSSLLKIGENKDAIFYIDTSTINTNLQPFDGYFPNPIEINGWVHIVYKNYLSYELRSYQRIQITTKDKLTPLRGKLEDCPSFTVEETNVLDVLNCYYKDGFPYEIQKTSGVREKRPSSMYMKILKHCLLEESFNTHMSK